MSMFNAFCFQGAAGKDGPSGSNGDQGAKVCDTPNTANKSAVCLNEMEFEK